MDQLNTDLATLVTVTAALQADVEALGTPTGTVDPNDAVVSSMVSALESAGYTVTPPDTSEPELPEGPVEDSTDSSTES